MTAVNMKNFKFTRGAAVLTYKGFGAYDEQRGEFVSHNGRDPYTIGTKRTLQSFIDNGAFINMISRVKPE